MKKMLLMLMCLVLFLTALLGCRNKDDKSEVVTKTKIQENLIKEKDSIDVLVENRAKQLYEGTIFAGLKFGDSEQMVERTFRNKEKRYILIPTEERVCSVYVHSYKPTYYEDKLASIVLYVESDELYYDVIYPRFVAKYGKIKEDARVYVESNWFF